MKIAHFRNLLASLLLALPALAFGQEQDAGVTEVTDAGAPVVDAGAEPAPAPVDAGPAVEPAPAAPVEQPEHAEHEGHMGHMGAMSSPLGLTHARLASGTSWQPDSTPVYAIHLMSDDWMFMFHGLLHVGFIDMVGPRGDLNLVSTNWAMAMADHPLAGGQVELRAMISAEPVTVPQEGYPLLLQTGETCCGGQILHDHQHAHDLFMELAAVYRREVVSGVAFEVYGAAVGEPAIGPTAFPHRESASFSMLAPLSHHHLDSTHVSFGVVTADVYTKMFKVEGSAFNGREPDEERFNFDFAPFDSYSVRAQVAPLPELVAQVSYAYLGQPERQLPGVSQRRVTASATFDRRVGEGNVAATLAWGLKRENDLSSNAVLGEINADIDGSNSVFGRLEWVERSADDLDVPLELGNRFSVGEVTVGAMHELDPVDGVRLGFGGMGYLGYVPAPLNPIYNGDAAPGFVLFGRLRLVGNAK